MATSSVLESACLGNVCQGTDERTHGTLFAPAGTWKEEGEQEGKPKGLKSTSRAAVVFFFLRLLIFFCTPEVLVMHDMRIFSSCLALCHPPRCVMQRLDIVLVFQSSS